MDSLMAKESEERNEKRATEGTETSGMNNLRRMMALILYEDRKSFGTEHKDSVSFKQKC